MTTTVEYRVRPVTRYVVTRFVHHQSDDASAGFPGGVGSSLIGEFANQHLAASVAEAFSDKDANVNRVVWEPHEDQPDARPAELIVSVT